MPNPKAAHLTLFGLIVALSVLVLALSVKGLPGNPKASDLNSTRWKTEGPFETSPERGRFVLLYSLFEDRSFNFSLPLARFAAPDVGYFNSQYVSLFAPAVSFVAMPGYALGKIFQASQVGSFAVIALFAFFNLLLIIAISRNIGASPPAAILSGLAFLFASPAFPYAVNLYQHHVSVFLILVSIYALLRFRSILALPVVWAAAAFSVSVDYPNALLMLPVAILALGKMLKTSGDDTQKRLHIRYAYGFTVLSALLPVAFFLWFNQNSYHDPLRLSGTVPQAVAIDSSGNPTSPNPLDESTLEAYIKASESDQQATGFFNTRAELNGLYILSLSPDRGTLYFTPVLLVGLLAIWLFLKDKTHPIVPVLVAVLGVNLLLYSMWGDPWGGWSFGARYLLPAYAMLAILLSLVLTHFQKNLWVLSTVLLLFAYSAFVNTLGAITPSANPPRQEIAALEKVSDRHERYSFDRNMEALDKGVSNTYFYQTQGRKLFSTWQYFWTVYLLILSAGTAAALMTYRAGMLVAAPSRSERAGNRR